MKKRGFTLVELLAVIAILAILAIVILPNVIESFNKSKDSNFLAEAEAVYKAATNQYVLDRVKGEYYISYSYNVMDSPDRPLDISKRDGFSYKVTINSDGEVEYFFVKDADHRIELTGDVKLKDLAENYQ